MSDSQPSLKATKSAVKVAEALLENPSKERHGFDIAAKTKLKSGTVYPILLRFENARWLESRWEESEHNGRPPKRMYRLTAIGVPAARELVGKAKGRKRQVQRGTFGAPFPAGGSA